MSTHARLSPSKRHRWAACPGSVREEAKFPERDSGPAAVDGTHSHTLLEHCIKGGLKDPTKMVGIKLKDDDGEFKVDLERAERVKMAIDYIAERVDEQGGMWMCQVLAEQRVDPERLVGRDDLSGTVDCQIRGPKVLEIIDYKDGMGIVEAENNAQLEQYAIGALASVDVIPWEEIRMTIIQPKLAYKAFSPITSWTVPVEYLKRRVDDLRAEAEATDDPAAPLVPGESQCKYCQAKGSCTALASNVMKEIGVMFQPVSVSPVELAEQSANKDPATMDGDQIRQIMEAAPLLRQMLEAVEQEALRRMKEGQTIPGLKLVNGRGSRSWALSEDEIADKLIKMGVPKASVYETKLVSPAKAEKLKWEKRDGTKVSLSDRQLKKLEQNYIVKLAGKLTVVPESDGRPAVVNDATPLFKALEAPEPVSAPTEMPSWLV